jgi:hypothetical protein
VARRGRLDSPLLGVQAHRAPAMAPRKDNVVSVIGRCWAGALFSGLPASRMASDKCLELIGRIPLRRASRVRSECGCRRSTGPRQFDGLSAFRWPGRS